MTNEYNPANDPYEVIEALEKSGFIVVVLDLDNTESDPRLLVGLNSTKPTTNEIIEALKQHEISIEANRLKPVSYGNFHEYIF